MNRIAVVSGGGTGMGRAIARMLVAEGDRVIAVARRGEVLRRTAEELNREAARKAVTWYAADLTSADNVQTVAGQIDEVDVLVNAAGGIDRSNAVDLAEIEASWLREFKSNVVTAALLTAALEPRIRRPGGRIVNISSIAALRGGGDAYSAAKSALIGWTYHLAATLGPQGITANVIAPGFIDGTEFFGDSMTAERRERLIGQ